MTWTNLGEFYVILGQITRNAKQKVQQLLGIVIVVDNFSKLEVLAPDIKLVQIRLVRLDISFLSLRIL
jgi:hypothetical protein